MKAKSLIYPLFMPQMGCPGTCVYCDQYAISGAQDFCLESAKWEVQAFVDRNKGKTKEIAFYGGTFTALGEDFRETVLSELGQVIDNDTSFRISTHPLFIDDSILQHCNAWGIRTIELGIQDFDDKVLEASGRGYTYDLAIEACKLVKDKGFVLGVQLIPGLPVSDANTIEYNQQCLHSLQPEFLRLYPLVVLKNTVLCQMYRAGTYQPLKLEEAIRICADYTEFCEAEGIRIIKYGLPSNLDNDAVVAGAWHPAFGELVLQELLKRRLNRKELRMDQLDARQRQLLRAQHILVRQSPDWQCFLVRQSPDWQ